MPKSTHHQHYQVFLELLRELRESKGISQGMLAERLGNHQTFVSKVERGERRLDVVEFAEWCEHLGEAPEAAFIEFLAARKRATRSRKLARGRGRGR